VAAEAEEVAALTEERRSCCVCFDDAVPLVRRGLDCGRGHFTCGDCLAHQIASGQVTKLGLKCSVCPAAAAAAFGEEALHGRVTEAAFLRFVGDRARLDRDAAVVESQAEFEVSPRA
jgi:hypothetical protein